MDKKPCVAVVGTGYWGKNLVRTFDNLGALRAVCDTDRARLDALKVGPDVKFYSAVGECLGYPEVSAVAIATPAETHFELASAALAAGRDVFVEKPLALSVDDGQELVKLARAGGRVLMVGHILRYHPAVTKLGELIAAGELGRVEYVYSNRLNIGKLRTEENILWSFAPHDVSVLLGLVGEIPAQISCQGGDYLSRGVSDVTVSQFLFQAGVRAHIFVSWLHPFKEQRLVVVGSEKMAVFDDTAADKLVLYPHRIEWKNQVPTAVKAESSVVAIDAAEPLKLECGHFLQCLETRAAPLTDGEEGLRVLKVLDACQRSLSGGGYPQRTEIPQDPQITQIAQIYPEGHCRVQCTSAQSVKSADASSSSRPGGSSDVSAQSAKSADSPRGSGASVASAKSADAPPYFVHETAFVDDGAEVGAGTKVWHFAHVMKGARIGERCILGQNVNVDGGTVIGNNVKIQNNVAVYTGTVVEDDVFLGPSCVLTNVTNPRSQVNRHALYEKTVLRRGCTIGANSTVVCGTTVGRYAFVAAGSVVTADVPDYALVMGNPARQKGWMSRHGQKLGKPDAGGVMVCPESGLRYREASPGVVRCLDLDEEAPLPPEMTKSTTTYREFRQK